VSACGYTKLRYPVIGAYCSTGAVHLANIAHSPGIMNEVLLTLLRGLCLVTLGVVWRAAPWPAIQDWKLPESKVPSMYLDDYALSVPGRPTIVARNFIYVDVKAVWRVPRVVSGIRADTISAEQPHVDRLGLYEKERSLFRVIGRLCVPSLARPIIVARNVIYVDVRAVWRVSRVASGI
jgi:hypothetical protein